MNQIIITDSIILEFYKENTNLDIVTMNRILIDILKNLSTNMNTTINNTINNKILTELTDLSINFNAFKQDYSKINNDIIFKMLDIKKEYIEDIKLILNNHNLTNSEKISSLFDKNNDLLLTKTNHIVNDIVPKSQDKLYGQIDSCIKKLYSSINTDTNKLFENMNKDDTTIKECFKNIETQFDKMIGTIQQPIFNYIQSSEERTSASIQFIKEKINTQHVSQDILSKEMTVFLNKYKYNSHVKGSVSETELYSVLQQIFVSDEIIDCSGETATCDYKVNRFDKNKPTILFENKDYSRSVTTDEVLKFERDLKLQKHHGIFLSQNSYITYKEQFHIDIKDGLIHIYINNVCYNQDKIKIAVDIIDSLSVKLKSLNNDVNKLEHIYIDENDLNELLEEYNEFIKQKTIIIDSIKLNNKILLEKLEDLHTHSVKKLLIKNNIIQGDDENKCKFCNCFSGKNKASLGAHIRNCKFNPINIQQPMVLELEIKNDIQPTMESANNTVINTQQISKKKSSKNK
jgi:hypothetical protein